MALWESLKLHLANPRSNACDQVKNVYSISADDEKITFLAQEKTCVYMKRSITPEQYNKYTGIYMVYNEYTVEAIRDILDVVNKKKAVVFFYYDDMDAFRAFFATQQPNTVFLTDDSFLLFFSLDDIEAYFNSTVCQYPRIYLNVPNEIRKVIVNKKNREIIYLREQMDVYYETQNLCDIKNNFKILICSDLFNMGTMGCMAKDYESAFLAAGIDYSLTVEDYAFFHYYEEVYFLRKVMEYKPSAVIGMNVSYASFPYYISRKLPIISQIDSGNYAVSEQCYEHMGEYTVFLLPFITLENTLAENFIESKFKSKAIKYPFVADCGIYKEYELTEEEKKQYGAEICIMGNSTTSKEVLYQDYINAYERFFMRSVDTERKKEHRKLIEKFIDECFTFMQKQEQMLSYENFLFDLSIERFVKSNPFWNHLDEKRYSTIALILEFYLVIPIYRICVMEWLMQNDFDLKSFGMRWNDHLVKWGGALENGVQLSKAYCASKIAIHSNLPNGVHRRFFEASLSGGLCLCPRSEKRLNASDLALYFEEGKEIVYFNDKQDLYQKIKYYLSHEKERREIVQNCQRVIYKNKLDVKIVLGKVVKQAIEYIEKIAAERKNCDVLEKMR